MSNPTPIDHDGHDELHHGLRAARAGLALQERIAVLQSQLSKDWEAHRQAVQANQATGLSPVGQLKLEALASIAALSNFHCAAAHDLIHAGDHEAAHCWTLDEGALNVAFDVLSGVDLSDI
jgi:hypothetical protein